LARLYNVAGARDAVERIQNVCSRDWWFWKELLGCLLMEAAGGREVYELQRFRALLLILLGFNV